AGGGGKTAAPLADEGEGGGSANQKLATSAPKQGSIRNGLSHAQNVAHQGGGKNGSHGPASKGAGFAGAALRINGGIHIRGQDDDGMILEAFASAFSKAGNGQSFASSSIRINGGIHVNGHFGHAFREAGRCCCDDGH